MLEGRNCSPSAISIVTARPYQLYRENYRPEQQDWLVFLQDFATLVSKYELNPAE